MSASFFKKSVGESSRDPLEVKVVDGSGRKIVGIDASGGLLLVTPEQAREIGRALIKAGKFADKVSAAEYGRR